ncbi:DUF5050 domain-containing protein [Anaerosporobacter faecicola]|uniref:DUF5050 domain-containing protein n=1 Tax=Anaerosporobacter faecicola TaxID=2718714 RepID=UPI00143B0B11|nr:DUF5050 domain-containing protein [Anaerosporobacter faecicola]
MTYCIEKGRGKSGIIWLMILACIITSMELVPGKAMAAQTVAQYSQDVVEDGGYLFYKTGTKGSTYKLVSQKVGTTKKTTLTTNTIDNFYVLNKYVYYVVKNTRTSKNSIYRVDRNGKNRKCLVTAFQGNIIGVIGNYVYYSYYKSYEKMIIARIKVTGTRSTNKILCTTKTNHYNFKPVIANNRIYYTNNKRTILYYTTLGGKVTKEVATDKNMDQLTAGADALYYICNTNDGTIKSSASAVKKVEYDGSITTLDYFDHDRISLYRVNAGGEAANDYTDFSVNLQLVTEDAVYYSVTDGDVISYLFERNTTGDREGTILLDEKDFFEKNHIALGVISYRTDGEYQLIEFGNYEDPSHFFYISEDQTSKLSVAPKSITIHDGKAYYRIVQSSKIVYKATKITSLCTQ